MGAGQRAAGRQALGLVNLPEKGYQSHGVARLAGRPREAAVEGGEAEGDRGRAWMQRREQKQGAAESGGSGGIPVVVNTRETGPGTE